MGSFIVTIFTLLLLNVISYSAHMRQLSIRVSIPNIIIIKNSETLAKKEAGATVTHRALDPVMGLKKENARKSRSLHFKLEELLSQEQGIKINLMRHMISLMNF